MKIRKSTIVWFVLAVLIAGSQFTKTDDSDKLKWSDATFVKGAQVLEENEGKLVAITGHPEMIENVTDEKIGVSFNSPKVYRSVDMLIYDDMDDEWKVRAVKEGKTRDGLENSILYGRVKVGGFELDNELIKHGNFGSRDIEKYDFTNEEIAHTQSTGTLVKVNSEFCYIDCMNMSNYKIWDNPDEYNSSTYTVHKDWDGVRKVNWRMWEIEPDDKVTIVGIQKGNTLTYCDNLAGGVSRNKAMTADEVKEEKASPIGKRIFGFGFALLFAYMGVRSMKKEERS